MSAPATPADRREHAVHTCRVDAAPQLVYGLVADVTRWPVLFGPTLHVEVIERGDGTERFRLWALVGGEARTWTSRRRLDPGRLRIDFEQERTQPPIASMGGRWQFRAIPDGTTEVVLEHDFAAAGDDPAAGERLAAAVDRNSTDELAALGRLAELGHPPDDLVFAFEDVVTLPVAPQDAYSFIDRAERWPERLPHVGRVVLKEPQPGVQDMEMDTVTSEGSRHTTRSIRLCFPGDGIVYKQLVPPALLLGHAGAWRFAPSPDGPGTVVTARHQVAVDPTKVEGVLGAGRTVDDARAWLRDALGANSRATLAHAGRAAP
jgi:aromatase